MKDHPSRGFAAVVEGVVLSSEDLEDDHEQP